MLQTIQTCFCQANVALQLKISNKKRKIKNYLHILNDDRKPVICAILCQEILTVTSKGEKFVVKRLEVRLPNN